MGHPRPVRRPPNLVLILVAGAAALVLAFHWLEAVVGPLVDVLAGGGSVLEKAPWRLLAAAPGLLVLALVGRVVLSLLPPGPLGSHTPRDLPVTWAASHLLGTLIAGLSLAAFEPRTPLGLAALLLPWAPVAGLRIATLPGAMVPRHDLRLQATDRAPTALTALVLLAALLPCVLVAIDFRPPAAEEPTAPWLAAHGPPLPVAAELLLNGLGLGAQADQAWRLFVPATWAALLVLLAHALELARRDPWGRTAVVVLGALTILPVAQVVLSDGTVLSAAFSGAAACAFVPWLRRADRRARWLALLALAGLAASGAALLALVGVAALLAATPGPSRRSCARDALATGAALGLCLARRPGAWSGSDLAPILPANGLRAMLQSAGDPYLWGLVWPVFALAVFWLPWSLRAGMQRAPTEIGLGVVPAQDPRRELVAVGLLLLGGLGLGAAPAPDTLLVLYGPALLFLALVLVPPSAERAATTEGGPGGDPQPDALPR